MISGCYCSLTGKPHTHATLTVDNLVLTAIISWVDLVQIDIFNNNLKDFFKLEFHNIAKGLMKITRTSLWMCATYMLLSSYLKHSQDIKLFGL